MPFGVRDAEDDLRRAVVDEGAVAQQAVLHFDELGRLHLGGL